MKVWVMTNCFGEMLPSTCALTRAESIKKLRSICDWMTTPSIRELQDDGFKPVTATLERSRGIRQRR